MHLPPIGFSPIIGEPLSGAKRLSYERASPYVTEPFIGCVGQILRQTLNKHLSPTRQARRKPQKSSVSAPIPPRATAEAKKIQEKLNRIETVVVRLPDGQDPASMDEEYFWDLTFAASQAQGVNLLEP